MGLRARFGLIYIRYVGCLGGDGGVQYFSVQYERVLIYGYDFYWVFIEFSWDNTRNRQSITC